MAKGSGRVTPRGGRRTTRRITGGTHLLPTEITKTRELIDGQDCITVQFEMPNVTFAIPLTIPVWDEFCDDIQTLKERGNPKERQKEDRTGSGLVIPSSEDVDEHGRLPRLR